jgi:hypothetical protein
VTRKWQDPAAAMERVQAFHSAQKVVRECSHRAQRISHNCCADRSVYAGEGRPGGSTGCTSHAPPNCSCLMNIREGHVHGWPTPWTVQRPEDGTKHWKIPAVSLHMVTCARAQRGKEDRAAVGHHANLCICN